ncbi:MAG TPA: undecaprenyl-phosphate galactose phosphotransferase WbaP [Tepidisphaeraceae bacterium]
MAAFDRVELGIELDEFDRIVPDRPLRRPQAGSSLADSPDVEPSGATRSVEAVPLAELAYPPAAPTPALCWQGIRTTAPIVAADLLALAVSGLFAAAAVHFIWPHAPILLRPMAVVVALLPLAYWLCGLYSPMGSSPILELRHLIQVNSIGFIAAALGGMLAPPMPLWCLAAWVASVGLVPLLRSIVRRHCARTDWWGRPTLVISPAETSDSVVLALMHSPTCGFRPVAVTDPAGPCWSALTPAVNDPDQLEKVVREQDIRYAVVHVADSGPAAVNEIFARYSSLIPHLLMLTNTPDLPSLWNASRSCGRVGGVEMSNARLLSSLWTLKRAVDIVVALIVLVTGFPLMALIAVAVKLTSPGPIFYGHKRLGFGGKWFKAWKFRTMHANGDAVLHEHLATNPHARVEWDRDHKLRKDPRVTRLGGLLRRSSLDELPQVWNVLKGEMSLVGPRPIVAKEVAKYGNIFGKYAAVKPGITGMWQVSGRNEVSYEERVKLDRYYIANWSPWLDLYILAKTILVLIRRDGAY